MGDEKHLVNEGVEEMLDMESRNVFGDVCSFQEDDPDNICSFYKDDTCGSRLLFTKGEGVESLIIN